MEGRRPNILLITTDEMRKDVLGCYGGRVIKTPSLDTLAEESITFDRGYCVSPWCLPSRCSILTGLFPHNSGAYSNFRKCELNGGIPNLFNVLKGAGYRTSLVGKCHFAPVPYSRTKPDVTLPYEEFREYYMSLGIDHLDLQDDKQVSVWCYDDYARELDAAGYLEAYRKATWDRSRMKVFPFPGPTEWHPDTWVGRKSVEYINSLDQQGESFIWVSFSGPHYPFDAPSEYYDRVNMEELKKENHRLLEGEFDSETRIHHKSYHGGGRIDGCGMAPDKGCKNYSEEYWLELRRNYYANMAQIDDQVGCIVEAAKAKFGDNLLIIFTSDHGEMLGNHGVWGKHNCAYEDVWNVPLLVKYPGQEKGSRTAAKVMLTDIFATCMSVTGVKGVKTDGADFREVIGWDGYEYVLAEGEGYVSVSDGSLKYVHINKAGEEFYELLDLSRDPDEFHNVIDKPEYQEGLARLRKQVVNHFMKKLLP